MKIHLFCRILGIAILTFFCACNGSIYKEQIKPMIQGDMAPPNGIIINKNFFIDETEVTNIAYKEFLYSVKKDFGKNSKLYKSVLPDTSVWITSPDDTLKVKMEMEFGKKYLRHPDFDNFPVVGISKRQAEIYSEWRSLIVFEVILIERGIINPESDGMFSLQSFLNNECEYRNDNFSFENLFFHEFRLPRFEEYQAIIKLESPQSSDCLDLKREEPLTQLRGVRENCRQKLYKKTAIFNLDSNVSEMTNIDGLFFGNAWVIHPDTVNGYSEPTNWLGFRNVSYQIPLKEAVKNLKYFN